MAAVGAVGVILHWAIWREKGVDIGLIYKIIFFVVIFAIVARLMLVTNVMEMTAGFCC